MRLRSEARLCSAAPQNRTSEELGASKDGFGGYLNVDTVDLRTEMALQDSDILYQQHNRLGHKHRCNYTAIVGAENQQELL